MSLVPRAGVMSPAFFLSLPFLLSSLSHFLFPLSRLSVRWPSAGFIATARERRVHFLNRSRNIPKGGNIERHVR